MNFERAKSWLTIIKSLAPFFKYDVERVRNLKTVDLKCAMIARSLDYLEARVLDITN